MNRSHTALVLTKIAALDNRRLDDPHGAETPILDAWHELIGHLRYEDCIQAVTEHRRESTDWLLPAHIITRVKAIRAARISAVAEADLMADHGPIEAGQSAADYVHCLRERTRLVGDGMTVPQVLAASPRAITAGAQ